MHLLITSGIDVYKDSTRELVVIMNVQVLEWSDIEDSDSDLSSDNECVCHGNFGAVNFFVWWTKIP